MSTVTLINYGTLPAVRLQAGDGAVAVVTLFGAHLVSWHSADGAERLFCSRRSALDGSRAIRGGVPLIFPQFAERGSGMRHGFARVCPWRLVGSGAQGGAAFALFSLEAADLPPAMAQAWPHAFALLLRVAVGGPLLTLTLEVRNTGAAPFAFASALHTYFGVDQIGQVSLTGLAEGELRFPDKVDTVRKYAGPLRLTHGAGVLQLEQSGFADVVLWNPGAIDAGALSDLDDAEYQQFVCIEPALLDQVTLAPAQAWRGEQRMTVLSTASSIP